MAAQCARTERHRETPKSLIPSWSFNNISERSLILIIKSFPASSLVRRLIILQFSPFSSFHFLKKKENYKNLILCVPLQCYLKWELIVRFLR